MKTLIFPTIAVVTTAIAAYLIGHDRGVRKGAQVGATLASTYVDAHKDFVLLLEHSASKGAPEAEEIKSLMVEFLSIYPSQRALLQAPPFSVSFPQTPNERIDAAIERLKTHRLKITYAQEEPIQSTETTRGK
jgi:hypothetical protein